MKKLILLLVAIFSLGVHAQDKSDESQDELWVMISINSNFRDLDGVDIVDFIAEKVEEAELGELDGHSSGANQLEFNFYNVTKYNETEVFISKLMETHFPEVKYVISNNYEATFEKL